MSFTSNYVRHLRLRADSNRAAWCVSSLLIRHGEGHVSGSVRGSQGSDRERRRACPEGGRHRHPRLNRLLCSRRITGIRATMRSTAIMSPTQLRCRRFVSSAKQTKRGWLMTSPVSRLRLPKDCTASINLQEVGRRPSPTVGSRVGGRCIDTVPAGIRCNKVTAL